MKAKDYFNKYKNGLASESKDTYVLAMGEMYQEMFKECVDTMHTRNIKRNDAVVSVFKEMNEKYNAICRLLAKEYGNSSIKENGFAVLVCDTCEFLRPYFSKELKSLNKESEVAERREDIENSPADCSTPSVTDQKGEGK